MSARLRRPLHAVSLLLVCVGVAAAMLAIQAVPFVSLKHEGAGMLTLVVYCVYLCGGGLYLKVLAVLGDLRASLDADDGEDPPAPDDSLAVEAGANAGTGPARREEAYRKLGLGLGAASLLLFAWALGGRFLGGAAGGAPPNREASEVLIASTLLFFGVLFLLSSIGRIPRRGQAPGEAGMVDMISGAPSLPPKRPDAD